MANSKPLKNEVELSPFSLWLTSYEFLVETVKTWAFKIFGTIMDKVDLVNFISEFTYLVINLITNGITIFQTGNKYLMTLAGVGFFSTFYLAFQKLMKLFPNFKPLEAMNNFYIQLVSYRTKENLNTDIIYPNSEDLEQGWIKHVRIILTAFFSAIVGGLGYLVDGAKGISNAFRLLTATKTGVENISSVIEKTVNNIVLDKVDPMEPERRELLKLVEKGQAMNMLSIGDIASVNEKRKEVRNYITEATQAISLYRSHETNSLRVMLVSLIKDISKKLEEIDHILPFRQVTAGVFICGEKGVGKSTLVTYLAEQLAKSYGLQKKLYNVSAGVRFYEPYLNEDFGLVNEFGSATKEETFVYDANRICSSDPFNFESASLGGKIGSCQLKMLFVTSNITSPLIPELRPCSQPAFWDRFIIIEAIDPKIKNRRQVVTHRKSDFSHLTFNIKEVKVQDNQELEFENIFEKVTITSILDLLNTKMALETYKYYNALKIEQPSHIRHRLAEDLYPITGSLPSQYFGISNEPEPNSQGRNFCIMRIQGMEGTGKTCTAKKLAKSWLELTGCFGEQSKFSMQISETLEEFKPINKPCIYILDDWVTLKMSTSDCQKYVGKMNKTHEESIFIITTNEVIRKVRIYDEMASRVYSAVCGMDHNSPYDLKNKTEVYTGMFRRIGLDEHYMVGKLVRKVNSTEYCCVINVNNRAIYEHKHTNVGVSSMLELLKARYVAMCKDRYSITVLKERPQEEEHQVDMEIIAENPDILFNKLKTTLGAASLYLHPTNQASLTVSPRIVSGATNLGRAVKPADFICDEVFSEEIPKEERYITVVERMVRVLLQYYSQPTFRIIIKSTGEVIYSKDSVVYYYNLEAEKIHLVTEDNVVHITFTTPKSITSTAFANMLCADSVEERFVDTNITCEEYLKLENYYKECLKLQKYNSFICEAVKEVTEIEKRKNANYVKALIAARNDKLLTIALYGIVGVSSLGVMYGLYKLVKNIFTDNGEQTDEVLEANAFANVGSTPPKRSEHNQSQKNKKCLGAEEQETYNANIKLKHDSPDTYHPKKSNIYANKKKHNDHETYHPRRSDIYVNNETVKEIEEQHTYLSTNNLDHNKEPHEHLCKHCGCLYSHIHNYNAASIHPQWRKQCPNEECSNYHGEEDKLQSVVIQKEYHTTKFNGTDPNNIVSLLGDDFSPLSSQLLRALIKYSPKKRNNICDQLRQARTNNVNYMTVLKQYPELESIINKATIVNMLTDQDMIESQETELEVLHRQLRKSYVRINVGQSSAYALHVGKGFFLTVSHCFWEVGETAILSSEGNRHTAQCVALLRNRDISVVYSSTLNNLPSAKRFFVKDNLDLASNGYFLRCGPTFEVISGALEYKAYQGQLEGKSNIGERYAPTTEILKIRRLGLECARVIKKGDCGFPFICRIGGSMKVVGFHNAYKIESCFFGAFVSQPLIEDMCDITVTNSTEMSTCGVVTIPVIREGDLLATKVSMPIEYINAFDNVIKPDPYFPKETNSTSLISIGYNNIFKNHSQSRSKHVTHELQLTTPNLTLPAAYTLDYVQDYSELILDGKGRPSPLWTQACKYNLSEQRWDHDTMEHAIELCHDYNKLTYRDKPFRILNEFEALNGTREPFLSNVDITTSAGPYAKYFGKILTKKQILHVEYPNEQPIYSFNDTWVAQNIKSHLKQQTQLLEEEFIPPCLISQDNAKVENIGMEKARKGKVRLFNNVDPSVNGILKKYFGDWFAHVMAKHQSGYYAVGQDPYITSTEIYHAFAAKQGIILNTDFKAFDKLLIPKLIQAFCHIASRLTKPKSYRSNEWLERVYAALATTLTHAVHILDGSVYVVNNGNESGTFVTTLLNCVSVHIIFNYTFITFWNQVPKFIGIRPSLKDVMSRSEIRILGDDKTQKVSYDIPMSEQDLIHVAEELGMKCTPAKGDYHEEELIDFCSRVLWYDEKDQVVYPRLKKESINGLLYWFASFTPNQVRDNLMIALFEASFYPKEYYEQILDDALIVAHAARVDPRTIPFTNYFQARRRLRSFIMNDVECQKISALTDRETNNIDIEEYSKYLKRSILSEDHKSMQKLPSDVIEKPDIGYRRSKTSEKRDINKTSGEKLNEEEMAASAINNNVISKSFELISKLGKTSPRETFERDGPDHSPVHTCTIEFEDREFCGEGASKANAKTEAYGALYVFLRENVIPNAYNAAKVVEAETALKEICQRGFSLYVEQHIETARQNSGDKRYVTLISSKYDSNGAQNINGFLCFYNNGTRFVLSPIIERLPKKKTKTCYLRYPGVSLDEQSRELTLDTHADVSTWSLRTHDILTYSDDEELIVANSAFWHTKLSLVPVNFETNKSSHKFLKKTKNLQQLNIYYANNGDEVASLGVTPSDNPVVVPSAAVLASDKEIVHPTIMNYSAPSNSWMSAGGIMHNIMDQIYNQYIWSTQFLVESTAARGKIIMQIPYTPVNNTFASSFIMNALLLHGRFSGDWIVRLSCPGSAASMQGSLIVAWQPKKVTGDTAAMEELTKYSYFTNSVATPWTQDIVMRDARQDGFYREVPRNSGKTTSDPNQPHIVIAVESPGVSTFKDTNKVYISVASKLCSAKDQMLNPSIKPFVMADPQNTVKYDSTRGYTLNF